MVAYQGEVAFEHAGSRRSEPDGEEGHDRRGHDADEDERAPARCSWRDTAQDIHLLYLENDAITVNGANLLAFDAGIDWDIKRVEGVSGMMGGGLFNMALTGTGWVAIVSDGPPVLLNTGRRPDVRRPAGGDHLGVERPDRDQDRHQAEELHRQGLGRVRPDVVLGRRAGCSCSRARAASHGGTPSGGGARRPAGEPERLRAWGRAAAAARLTSFREVLLLKSTSCERSDLPRLRHRGHHLRQVDDPRHPRPRRGPQPLLRARALARGHQPADAVAAPAGARGAGHRRAPHLPRGAAAGRVLAHREGRGARAADRGHAPLRARVARRRRLRVRRRPDRRQPRASHA